MANPLICVFNPVTSFIDEIQSVSTGPATNGVPIVTNFLGVIDTSLLGIGSIATAGQALSAGQLVNLYSFGGTLHAQVASAQSPTFPNPTPPTPPSGGSYPLQAQGFAAQGASTSAPLTISFFGTFKYIDGNSEFNAGSIGAEVYLSDRGDGSPTLTPPSGGGELEQSVGYVVAFLAPNVVTINFASGFQDFTHISGVNPITKGGTGATTSAQALINLINNPATTGQALIFNGTNWVPGSAVTPFTDITSGTNTTAAMVVGTGASLSASGSGTIAATSVPFSGLTTSANISAILTLGSGGTLTFSGTGVVNANQLTGVVISTTPPSVGQVLTATSPTAANWQTPSADSDSFSVITSGTNTTATMTVGSGASIVTTGTGVVEATELATTGAAVVVGGAAPPTAGQFLIATSPTAAAWALPTSYSIVTKTATYTATSADGTILGNTTGGAFSIHLPISGIPVGQTYRIKNIGSPANTLTIDTVGGATNIDFALTQPLSSTGVSIDVQWDGTQWWIL